MSNDEKAITAELVWHMQIAHNRELLQKLIGWLEKNGIWAQVWFEVKEEHKTMWCLFEEDWEALKQLMVIEASQELLDKFETILAEHDLNSRFSQPE